MTTKPYKPQMVDQVQRILEDAAIYLTQSRMPEDTRDFVVRRLREIAKSEKETKRFAGIGRGRPIIPICAPTGKPTDKIGVIESEGYFIEGNDIFIDDLHQPLNRARVVWYFRAQGYPLKDNKEGAGALSRAAEICHKSGQALALDWNRFKGVLPELPKK